jgi:hypothetical protein
MNREVIIATEVKVIAAQYIRLGKSAFQFGTPNWTHWNATPHDHLIVSIAMLRFSGVTPAIFKPS